LDQQICQIFPQSQPTHYYIELKIYNIIFSQQQLRKEAEEKSQGVQEKESSRELSKKTISQKRQFLRKDNFSEKTISQKRQDTSTFRLICLKYTPKLS
jgi:hypothetical protein